MNNSGLYIRWKDIWDAIEAVLEVSYVWTEGDIQDFKDLVDDEFQKVIRNGKVVEYSSCPAYYHSPMGCTYCRGES
jgi:hypothetical protein